MEEEHIANAWFISKYIHTLYFDDIFEVSMVPSDTMIYEFLIIYIINSFKSLLFKIKIPSFPKCLSLYSCFDLFCAFIQSKKQRVTNKFQAGMIAGRV